MKLSIDMTRCEGHGLCEEAAPHLIRLNDDGDPEFLTKEIDGHEAEARSAVRICPVAALRLS